MPSSAWGLRVRPPGEPGAALTLAAGPPAAGWARSPGSSTRPSLRVAGPGRALPGGRRAGRVLDEVALLVAFGAGGAEDVSGGRWTPACPGPPRWTPGRSGRRARRRAAGTPHREALDVDLAAEPLELVRQELAAGDFSVPEGAFALPPPAVTGDETAWQTGRSGPRWRGSGAARWPSAGRRSASQRAAGCSGGAARSTSCWCSAGGDGASRVPRGLRGLPHAVSECWSVPDLAALFTGCDLYWATTRA